MTSQLTSIDPFIARFDRPLEGSAVGPLAGLTIAVKDNFDVAGTITGGGSPEWAQSHPPAGTHAAVVSALLDQGGRIVGKTHMDELAFGLMGQNAHYGTPINAAAPLRMPGGSSSGSASAVASKRADIGLGSDTGGSVRLPAAFCGLFGWRPTHGLLSSQGMLGLAPSYDVPGFMTRDLETLGKLVAVFCGRSVGPVAKVRKPSDIWALASAETSAAFAGVAPEGDTSPLFDPDTCDRLLETFRICQGYEAAHLLGDWVLENRPAFGSATKERFDYALAVTQGDFLAANVRREELCTRLKTALQPGTILVYPTVPGPAPLLTVSPSDLAQYRNAALTILSIAGHAGLPQLTLPLADRDGAPVGLSLVGAKGSDADLLEFATTFVAKAAGPVA